ncbi:unnamed protein product [Schistosoma haematobium]|nr:unnamed protein product [Schistosoma haematobium]
MTEDHTQCYLETAVHALSVSTAEIQSASRNDSIVKRAMKYVTNGWPSIGLDGDLKQLYRRRDSLCVVNECLIFGDRAVVPDSLRSRVLKQFHTGHPGMRRMKSIARNCVYWPLMDQDIVDLVDRYIPSVNDNLSRYLFTPREYYISRWMSVTDLRGQPLAVRITSTGQSDSTPTSWSDLSGIEPINGIKCVLDPIYPIGQRLSQSASVFEHSPIQTRDITPNLHLHVNNFNRIRRVSSRCFTRKHQYNTVFGLDPCWSTLSGSQLNVINNNSGVKCQIEETSHYENLLEKRSKHNIEIDLICKESQMCIPQKQSKIKSCEFLNESILSCKLSNRINKSTGVINDGSEYSNVITSNHTIKHHQRKVKLSPKKHFLFKELDHICIPSKKFIKLFKFKRKKDAHSISEKFGTQSQLELAKSVKTLYDVGQSLLENSGDSVSNLNILEIQQQQQPSCSYSTTDKFNLSCLSIHVDVEEQPIKDTNNDDIFHQSQCLQVTPTQSADFSDSGLWSMSQMATEDCTNSLQQHLISCSESPVFHYYTNSDNNDYNNSDQTNEIRLQKSITSPTNESKFAEIRLSPWSSLEIGDGQRSKEFKLEKSNQPTDATTTITTTTNNNKTNTTTNISNEHGLTCIPLNQKAGVQNDTFLLLNCNSEQFVKDQLSNPSVSNINELRTSEALKLCNNDNNKNVTHNFNGPVKSQMSCTLNLKPFCSNSTSFEESKNDNESLHSRISKSKQNSPQENYVSSIYLSKTHNNNSDNASSKDFTQLSTFQQNSVISRIVQNNSMLSEYSLPYRISTTYDVIQIFPTTKIYDINNKSENNLSTVKVTDYKRSIGTHLINNNGSLNVDPLQINQDIKGIMIYPTLEQQNPYSNESTPLNTDQMMMINSQIEINVNSSKDLSLISVECENNSTFDSDIRQNMNPCVINNIQTLKKSLMESECTTHLPISLSTDTSENNHYLNKSFIQSLDNNAENPEYLNVVTDHQTNQLQVTNKCLPKQPNEQLTTTRIIEDITELSSAHVSTLFNQQKRDPLIIPDHAHDVHIDERLSVGSLNGSISDQLANDHSVPSTQVKQIFSSITETSHEDMKPLYSKSDLNNTRTLNDNYLLDNSCQNWMMALSNELTNRIDDSSETKYDFGQLTKGMSNDSKKLSTDLEINKLPTEKKVSSDEISQSLTILQPHNENVEVSCNKLHTPTKCHNRKFSLNEEDISIDVSSTKGDHLQDPHNELTNSEQPFVTSTAESISSNVNTYYTGGTNFYVTEPLYENTTIDLTNLTQSVRKLSISPDSLNNNVLDIDAQFNKVIKTENGLIDSRVKDVLQKCSLEDMNTLPTIINTVSSSSIQVPLLIKNKPVNCLINNIILNEDSLTAEMKLLTTLNKLLSDYTITDYPLEEKNTSSLLSSSNTNNYSRLKMDHETKNHFKKPLFDVPLEKQFHHGDLENITAPSNKRHNDSLQTTSNDFVPPKNSGEFHELEQTIEDTPDYNDNEYYPNTLTSSDNPMTIEPITTTGTTVAQSPNQSTTNSSSLSNVNDNLGNDTFTEHSSLFPIDSVKQFNVLKVSIPDNTDGSIFKKSVSMIHKETRDNAGRLISLLEKDTKSANQLDLTSKDVFIENKHTCTVPLIASHHEEDCHQPRSIDLSEKTVNLLGFDDSFLTGLPQATDEDLLWTKINHLQYPHDQRTNSEKSFMNTAAASLSSNVNKYCSDGTSLSVIEPLSENCLIDVKKLIQPIHNNNTFNTDTRSEFTSQLDVTYKDEFIEDNHACTILLITAYKEEDYGPMYGINSPSKAVDSLGIENSSLSRLLERNADNDNDYMASDATTTTTPSVAPNDDTVPHDLIISPTFTDKTNILLSSDISDNIELKFDNSLSSLPPSRDSEHSVNNSLNNSLELDFRSTINKLYSLMQYEYEFTDNNNNYWIDPGSLNEDVETIAQPMRSIATENSLEQPECTFSIYNTPSQQLSVVPTAAAATTTTTTTTLTAIQNPVHPINEIYIDEDYIAHLSLDDKNTKGILEPKIDKNNEEHKSNQRFKFTSGAYNLFTSVFNLATLYVPRHIYWLYGATFTPRGQFHRIMAGCGMELYSVGLSHPINVAGVFIGFTLASPYLRTWPYILSGLMNSSEINVFNPLYWIDRPILDHIGCLLYILPSSIRWGSTVIVNSFQQYPWLLANPLEPSSSAAALS